jgi:hypothetical protein
MVKHADRRECHGESKTPLWKAWNAMLQRCCNQRCPAFRWYGAKGVRVCPEWLRFTRFKAWALANGYEPGLTIDRKDSAGNYEPGNCRWITKSENCSGTARWHVTAFGETKTIGRWLQDERCKAGKESCIRMRLTRGWDAEKALTTPVYRP